MSYLINENSLAELTHGSAAERDTAGLNSGSNPFTSPHSPTTILAIPHQRGTPVKLFQWACRNTVHQGEWSVLWWPAGRAKVTL